MTCYLLWGIYFYQYTENWFGKKFQYLHKDQVRFDKKFRAYTRNDRARWNKTKFFLVGFFTLPIKVTIILLVIAITNLEGQILKYFLGIKNFYDNTEDNQQKFDKIFMFIMQLNTRIILFVSGFYWIPIKKVKFDQDKYKNLKASIDQRAQIIISNHVNPMDTYIICYLFKCSFVSKVDVKSYPLVGTITQFCKSLFVNRKNKNSRQQIFEDIKERIQTVRQNKWIPQLAIFPEGGTTNNKGIIDFRRGAFTHKASLRIVSLKYQSSQFDLGFTLLYTLSFCIGMLCNTWNKVQVQVLDTLIERRDDSVTDEEYMKEIKRLMCEEMGFENIEGFFYERQEFEDPYIGTKNKVQFQFYICHSFFFIMRIFFLIIIFIFSPSLQNDVVAELKQQQVQYLIRDNKFKIQLELNEFQKSLKNILKLKQLNNKQQDFNGQNFLESNTLNQYIDLYCKKIFKIVEKKFQQSFYEIEMQIKESKKNITIQQENFQLYLLQKFKKILQKISSQYKQQRDIIKTITQNIYQQCLNKKQSCQSKILLSIEKKLSHLNRKFKSQQYLNKQIEKNDLKIQLNQHINTLQKLKELQPDKDQKIQKIIEFIQKNFERQETYNQILNKKQTPFKLNIKNQNSKQQ